MLVVTLAEWPDGDSTRAREIGSMSLVSKETGDGKVADYNVECIGLAKPNKSLGLVQYHWEDDGPWNLVVRAIRSVCSWASPA